MKIKNKLIGHFRVSEFLKYDRIPSAATFAKVFEWIDILNDVRKELSSIRGEDTPIIINSACRSKAHELEMGRTGLSQHVYQNYKGAVDVTCQGDIEDLYNILLNDSRISRVCIYHTKNFIHIDRLPSDKKAYRFSDKLNKWI